jgi:hypothetical protein
MECLYCLGTLPDDADDADDDDYPFCSPECEESYEEMECK